MSKSLICISLIVPLSISQNTLGHGAIPHDTPVERLIANLTAYSKEHPDDPDGYYRLARVHTMALERKVEFALAFEGGGNVRPAEGSWAKNAWSKAANTPPSTPEQLKEHLKEAIRLLNHAIEMRPAEASYRLTLACALEAGSSLAAEVDVWPLVPVKPDPSQKTQFEDMRQQLTLALTDDTARAMVKGMVSGEDPMGFGAWPKSVRDALMTVAYERRDQEQYKAIVQELRTLDWTQQIEDQFFTAMCYALPDDGKASSKPMWGGMDDWVSYEAGKDFIRVVESRKSNDASSIRLRVAKEAIKGFEGLPPPRGITPIVFDLQGRNLSELLSSHSSTFDLDGSGRHQQLSWVKPEVGILVWDPEHQGHITSGRQLFGSVSWWLFFENGYQALDALDNNRDGELTESELDGVAAWFDRNEDGDCDAGEVMSIQSLNVKAISTRATSFAGISPANTLGLRMNDGRVLPTYDWIATAVSATEQHQSHLR